jgi:tetratricopeptide (TPR) repeat protein
MDRKHLPATVYPIWPRATDCLSFVTANFLVARAHSRTHTSASDSLPVVEIGPGTGLFARLTMRHYAEFRNSDPTLPLLLFIIVDGSREMIDSLERQSLLDVPGCEVRCIQADLTNDMSKLGEVLAAQLPPGARATCVCNYLFDNLPASALRMEQGELLESEIELREWVPDRVNKQNGASGEFAAMPDQILTRTRYRPVEDTPPGIAIARRFLSEGAEIPFNAECIECLTVLASLEKRIDTVIVNDYRIDSLRGSAELIQYFGGSIALGLHYPTLDTYVSEVLGWMVKQPSVVSENIVSRLFTSETDPEMQSAFERWFSFSESRRAHESVIAARRARSERRFGQALSAYESAIGMTPYSWNLVVEVAHFAQSCLGRNEQAMNLAELALDANPICPQAWNLVGDCLYVRDHYSARKGFENALRLHANDARTLLNLAYCHAQDGDFEQALWLISRGLAVDRGGALSAQLLQRQQEIIARMSSDKESSAS